MKKYKYPIILSLIVFLFCLAYSFYFQIEPQGDELAYDTIAIHFLEGKGLVEKLDIPIEKDRGVLYYAQGYLLFLAGLYKLFGHHYAVVWIVQGLLHALASFFIFLICFNVFKKDISEKIGLLAMGIYGFWPDLIESTAMILTEPLFLFFVALSVFVAVKFFKNPDIKKAVLLSAVISLGTSVRTTLIIFILVLAVLLITKRPEKWLLYIFVLFFISTIVLISLMYQSYIQHGRFVVSTAAGYDLWVGNNINANGEFEPTEEIRTYWEEHGFKNIDKKGISEVKKFALEHPFRFLRLQLIKTSKYFSLIRPTGWWSHLNRIETSLTLFFSGLFGAIAFIFGISGIWHSFKKKNFFHRLLFYLAICGPIAVIPIVVGTRYRHQLYPFLAIFAAYFLVMLFLKKQKALYKIPLIVFVIFLLNSIYDLIANLDVFLEHLYRII